MAEYKDADFNPGTGSSSISTGTTPSDETPATSDSNVTTGTTGSSETPATSDSEVTPTTSDSTLVPSRGAYHAQGQFRFWCQKVLPLVYDDSLSYYELLCKVVDYLNKTMQNVAVLESDVTETNNQFANLQTFVNETVDKQAESFNQLQENLNNNIKAQDAAFQQLQDNLNADIEKQNTAFNDLQTNLNNNIKAQNDAFEQLQTNINNNIDLQNQAFSDLQDYTNEQITEIRQTYLELQQYVNDYFNNLDVQEEINKKLDNMASDGSLSALIKPLFDTYKSEIDEVMKQQNETLTLQNQKIENQDARISAIVAQSGNDNTEVVDARIGASKLGSKSYDSLGDAIRGQVNRIVTDALSNAIYNKDSILNPSEGEITTLFNDGATQSARSDDTCESIIIPIDHLKGTNITAFSLYGNHYMGLSTYEEKPTIGTAYIKASVSSKTDFASIEVDENANYLLIWYYYGTRETDVDPVAIRKSLYVYYGTISDYRYFKPAVQDVGYDQVLKQIVNVPNTEDIANKTGGIYYTTDFSKDSDAFSSVVINVPFNTIRGIKTPSFVLQIVRSYTRSVKNRLITKQNKISTWVRWIQFDENNTVTEQTTWYNDEADYSKIQNNDNYDYEMFPITSWDAVTTVSDTYAYVPQYTYHEGYVKNIQLETSGDGDVTIFIINSINLSVIRRITAAMSGTTTITVNQYINVPFYIAVSGNVKYIITSEDNPVPKRIANWSTIKTTLKEGDIVTLEDLTGSGSSTKFVFAIQANYYGLLDFIAYDGTKKTNSIRTMFVAGDSITAGHNQYTTGEHWWEELHRKLNYKIVAASRTGAGWSYYDSTNACKIAHNYDFSHVSVAVFAFGTNDYNANIPIGTIDDEYTYSEDSSQTFYAAIKYVITRIKETNPSCVIILSLPINRCNVGTLETNWGYGTANSLGFTLNDYCEAIVTVCKKYGFAYIDNRYGAFDSYALETLLYDKLHPSDYGYKLLGMQMTARISAILQPYTEWAGETAFGQYSGTVETD